MDTARFGMLEENRLTRTYGSDIARKLLILGDINTWVRARIEDYLGNESFAMELNPDKFPEKRKNELHMISDILRRETVSSIYMLLNSDIWDLDFSTNENREDLLTKFGLWTGE